MNLKTKLFGLAALGAVALGVVLAIPTGLSSLAVSSVVAVAIVVVIVKQVVLS